MKTVKAVLLAVPTLVGWATAQQSEDIVKGLPSLRVLYVSSKPAEVVYAPASISPVDQAGKSLKHLQVIPVGGKGLVSGMVSLSAKPEDIKTLKRRATARFGPKTVIRPVKLKSFAMWLLVKNRVVWRRLDAGGQSERIPVQALVPDPKGDARLIIALRWGRNMEPLGGKLEIDWKVVLKTLRKELKTGRVLTEERLLELSEKAQASGWARFDSNDSDAVSADAVKRVFLTELRRSLQKPSLVRKSKGNEPTKENTSPGSNEEESKPFLNWSVSYKLRENLREDSLKSSFDLSTSIYVEKVTIVSSTVALGS